MRPYFDYERYDDDQDPPIISQAAVYSAGSHRHEPDTTTDETVQPRWNRALEDIQLARDCNVTSNVIDEALAAKVKWLPEKAKPLVNIMPAGYHDLFSENWVDPKWPPDGDVGMLREVDEPKYFEKYRRFFERTIPYFAYHIWPIATGDYEFQVLFIVLSKTSPEYEFYDQLVSYAIFNPLPDKTSDRIVSALNSILVQCRISTAFKPDIEDYEKRVWIPQMRDDWSSGLRAIQVGYTLMERVRDFVVDDTYDAEHLYDPIRWFDADEVRSQARGHIACHALWDLHCKGRVVIEPVDRVRIVNADGSYETIDAEELDPPDEREPVQDIPEEFKRKEKSHSDLELLFDTPKHIDRNMHPFLIFKRMGAHHMKILDTLPSRVQAKLDKEKEKAEKTRSGELEKN
ncbi:hypothetical protein GGR57DRAFT_446927 [Xylariaceae sp. FL1272]|nr:hypothetical protein GGR57DRAFT_446927 [Xylariaceae sp. FL1272]